ncbi:uncharacterized protein LOC111324494 [Stylophora pistillata]|uniref:uncharacterized protein LOC111324494 n=1 Tax=Stylophora pistillata TaxID=50429 RepID=UPI000C0397E4|nr:uncharacterized protein LOC111324494 [Stylophora pistillata]
MATVRLASTRKRTKRIEGEPEDLDLQASGFKFSRQSRFRKAPQKKGSAKKNEQKKRRSSFVRGRKERKSLVFSSKKSELYKDIPTDLTPEERLKKLFGACLKGAMEKLENNPSHYEVDGIPNFTTEAKEVFGHLQTVISDSNIVDEAFKPTPSEVKQTPNPKNEELEAKARSRLAVTERLKTENKKWDKLLSSHQSDMGQKDREHQDDVNSTDQCPDFLSPEQHQLLSGKPSLKGLMDRLHETKLQMILQADTITTFINSSKEYEAASSSFLSEQVKSFAGTTFEAVKETGTPRTVIPRLLKKLF